MPHRTALAFIAVIGALADFGHAAEQKWELVAALPTFASSECVAPTSHERSLFELAADAIAMVDSNSSNWLDVGAQRFLARTQYRDEGASTVVVCIPEDVLMRVSDALTSRKGFGKFRLSEYQLELSSKLPDRSAYVVEAVAASAFNANVQPSEVFSLHDIRPYARTVLAGFGSSASRFGSLAFEQMSIETSMGTGAAQVAAAAGHPQALPRIERMMDEAIAAVPAGQPIPRETRNRLYELSWAIYFAGDSGKKYARPIHSLMRRRVQSWAPPFGMVDLQPKRLCEVLRRIEGEGAVRAYGFCGDEKIPFDQ